MSFKLNLFGLCTSPQFCCGASDKQVVAEKSDDTKTAEEQKPIEDCLPVPERELHIEMDSPLVFNDLEVHNLVSIIV